MRLFLPFVTVILFFSCDDLPSLPEPNNSKNSKLYRAFCQEKFPLGSHDITLGWCGQTLPRGEAEKEAKLHEKEFKHTVYICDEPCKFCPDK